MKKNYLIAFFATLWVTTSVLAQKPMVQSGILHPAPVKLTSTNHSDRDVISHIKMRSVQNEQEVIHAVAGEKKSYNRTADGWTLDSSTGAVSWATKTNETHVVFDGNDVYIKNPFSTFSTLTWIKGTRNGNTITFPNKQAILEQTQNGATVVYYAEKLRFNGTNAYLPVEGDITMTIDDKGVITYVGEVTNTAGYNDIIGLSDGQGGWYGYGDMTATFTPAPAEEAAIIPAHVTLDTYKMTYQGSSQVIKIGIDGTDVYATKLPDVSPSLTLKGTLLANGDIELPTGQYMGYNEIKGYNSYLIGINSQTQTYLDKITFTYNATAQTYTAMNQMVLFNTNRTELEYMFVAQNPVLERWTAEVATPADPSIQRIETATVEYPYNGILFTVPSTDVNGEYIDTDNLYYNILIDGKVLTLTQDVYTKLPVASMTNIPYAYNDGYDVQLFGGDSRLFFFFENDFETVGVQSLYIVGDVVNKSNIATIQKPESAIHEVTLSKPLGEPTYFDLFGRQLTAPQKGVNIERYPDGTTRKIIYNE